MNATRFFPTVLMTTFLCGAMIAPAFASDPVPAASPSASAAPSDPSPAFTEDDSADGTTKPIAAVSSVSNPRYTFVYGRIGSQVCVSLNDAQDVDDAPILVDVLSADGKLSRLQRAKIIADRLQKLCDADPAFVDHLQPGYVDTQVIVADAMGAGNSVIVTADPSSKRVAHARTCDAYARKIISDIDDGLKGIKFRDATFDYLLTGEQKDERGYEYYKQGMEAYRDSTKPTEAADDRQCDIMVAESKLATAIALLPDYQYCRLQLANIYAEQGDKLKAHALYKQVIAADPDDKQDAAARDKRLGLSAG